MATRYVWSGAAGAGTGADFTNAHTTFTAAITAAGAGDTYLVASDHSESNASAQTLTFKGTPGSPDIIISVNRGTGVPTQGAAFITTGANNITLAGSFIMDGVNFTCGSTTSAAILSFSPAAGGFQIFRNALLTCSNNASSRVSVASASGRVDFEKNVTIAGTSANNWLRVNGGGIFRWKDSTAWTGTMPSFLSDNGSSGEYILDGVDLSGLTSKTIRQSLASSSSRLTLINCGLVSSLAIGTFLNRMDFVRLINCSNADGKNRTEYHDYNGSATIERTIVRTGGASDGEDSISLKLVSSAGASRYFPATSQEIAFNVGSTGSKTVTVHVITDNVTLKDDECWLEVEYLGTSGSLDSAHIDDAPATVVAAGTNQASSSETWTTTGLTTPNKQQLSVTFTANKIGMHRFRIKVGKPSTTVYACPEPVIT